MLLLIFLKNGTKKCHLIPCMYYISTCNKLHWPYTTYYEFFLNRAKTISLDTMFVLYTYVLTISYIGLIICTCSYFVGRKIKSAYKLCHRSKVHLFVGSYNLSPTVY